MSAIVGNQLKELRTSRDITLEEVSEATYIKLHYLQAMEAGNFDALPSPVQARGFLRSYASFLGVDPQPLLDDLEKDPIKALVEAGEEVEVEEPVEPPPTAGTPESYFLDVGNSLRTQRETLGFTFEEVERHTHLRNHYLKALEEGDWDHLPSPVQGRGMLKNYAVFLGMDPDPLLLRFAEGLQTRLDIQRAEQDAQERSGGFVKRGKSRSSRFVNRDIFLGAVVVLVLVSASIWGLFRVLSLRSAVSEPEPTPPSIADVLLPSETPITEPETATPTPEENPESGSEDTPLDETTQPTISTTESIVIPAGDEGIIQVQVIVRQRAWMRVMVDNEVAFDGRVVPGAVYAFAGDDQVGILTGNAAGIQVIYNEQDLGILGIFGEVLNFVITSEGVQTPTPTMTLTPTRTPESTQTPTATSEAP